MKLFVDSTNNRKTSLRLDDREFVRTYDSPRHQDTFAFILDTLKTEGIAVKEITEIEVVPGPGSFTGSRLGIAIGNALAYALNIKINGTNPPIRPVYSDKTTWKS